MKLTMIISTNCSVVDSWKVGLIAPKQAIEQSSWKVKVKKVKVDIWKAGATAPPSKPLSKVVEKWPESKCAKVTDPASNLTNFSPAPPLPPNYTTEVSDLNWIYKVGLISSSISPDCHVQLSKWSSWYLELKNVACLVWDCAHCLLNSYAR